MEIAELLTNTRFPPGFQFFLMILYFPIGVFLIVCRVLIALHAYMVVCLLPRALARRQFVRAMMGVLGVHIWVDEDQSTSSDRPKILVSNYTSVMDHVVLDVVTSHIVPYHGNVAKVFQWVLGYKDLGSTEGRDQFKQNINTFIQEVGLPVFLQPEGVCTNNTVGLLKFDTLPFELELPVQPVSIQMSRLSFPCALTTVDSPRWNDVLWCFFTPVTVFKIKTHPVVTRGEEESVEEFTERVRTVIAEALNLQKTPFTTADVAEYVKRLKVPPPLPPPSQNNKASSVTTTSHMGNTGSCFDSVDAELRRMIQQVMDVLPQVPVYAVKTDLEQTKDVDATISNILEGRVVYREEEEPTVATPASQFSCADGERGGRAWTQDKTQFKASSFPRSPSDRHLSLAERKQQMLDTARLRYKLKHGLI